MGKPRYLIAAVLLLALTAAPLFGWPGRSTAVYAQGESGQRQTTLRTRAVWPFSLLTTTSSNENERKDKEDRQGREDNQSHDDNDDDDCCAPPPPPPQPNRSEAPPANQASACLNSGGSVSMDTPDGSVTAKVFQNNLSVKLERVDPGSIPAPRDGYVGSLVFRISASNCGGGDLGSLPGEANLAVNYHQSSVAGRDENDLRLYYWDGQRWAATPKQAADPGANYVSATITALGVYALTGD